MNISAPITRPTDTDAHFAAGMLETASAALRSAIEDVICATRPHGAPQSRATAWGWAERMRELQAEMDAERGRLLGAD